jgi:retron-type reverse transcriptase
MILQFYALCKQAAADFWENRLLLRPEFSDMVLGVVSPTLSNILLTPFDREMRLRGYQLTRFADGMPVQTSN